MRRALAGRWACALVLPFLIWGPSAVAAEPAEKAKPEKGFRKEAWSVWYQSKHGRVQGPALRAKPHDIVPLVNAVTDSPDVRITAANDRTLTENSVAVNPTNSNLLFCANNSTDWDGTQVNTIFGTGVGWSLDGGLTWTTQDDGPGGVGNGGDPAAAIDRSGKFYVGYITSANGQGVSFSTDTGATWTHVTIATVPGGLDLLDKNHLVVDNVGTSPFVGRVYSAWTEFISGGANENDIVLSRSTDGGATWSAGTNISNAIAAGSHSQGINLQTGPSGQLYATWTIYDSFPSDETAIGFNSSTDGGVSWAGERRILTNIRGHRITGIPNSTIRTNSFPMMAVDVSGGPRNGSLYIVWTNVGVPGVNTGDTDIYLIRSTDQGATWGTPVRVNTDATTNSQWFPWLSCDPTNGELNVIFYDRRDDPADTLATPYVAHSADGGATWTNLRVGDVQFNPTPIPGNIAAGYIGDYLGITSRECKVFPLSSDDRTTFYTAYTSPVTIDETPPTITCPANVVQNNDPGLCSAVVNYPNPLAADNCPGVTFACVPPSGSTFPVGVTNVTCTATDGSAATASCSFTVTVNDVEPPTITSLTASPNVLWPPNHKLVPVTISATASDNCDSSVSCLITSVSSNEPVTGPGFGNFAPDWIITGPQTLSLRAERAGFGTGRIYSVTDTCSDDSGNGASGVVTVTVPHDQRKH
jgi:hypothetical protein